MVAVGPSAVVLGAESIESKPTVLTVADAVLGVVLPVDKDWRLRES